MDRNLDKLGIHRKNKKRIKDATARVNTPTDRIPSPDNKKRKTAGNPDRVHANRTITLPNPKVARKKYKASLASCYERHPPTDPQVV